MASLLFRFSPSSMAALVRGTAPSPAIILTSRPSPISRFACSSRNWSRKSKCIRLSRDRINQQPGEDEEEERTKLAAFFSPEDLGYLWKLLTGSVLGSVLVKYGSVLVPEITRPNITQALLMIFLPVVVSVLLLINASSSDS
ncbi:uncharacterized protein LOC116253004 [Nymphaea colorata]|nr:uncharacterized protein LOC116253004 [Nymphaea colorata]